MLIAMEYDETEIEDIKIKTFNSQQTSIKNINKCIENRIILKRRS